MSAQDLDMSQMSDMSDPLWFLENSEDSESKDDRNNLSENNNPQGNSESERWRKEYDSSNTNEDDQADTKQLRPERINWDNTNSNAEKNPEQIKNKIDLFESFGGPVQPVSKDKSPEIHIVTKSDALDNSIIDYEIPELKTSENQSKPEIRITLNDEIEQTLNKENKIKINLENSADNVKRPTIYVLLKDKNGSIGKIGNTDLNTETCTEVGSTVINVNDFLSPGNQLSGNESISTAVSYSPSSQATDGSPQQMELVITIKDERNKPKESTFKLPSEERKIPITLEDALDSTFSNVSNRTRSSSNYMTSSDASWKSFSDGDSGKGEYSEERDSWVRESDGASCQRTVVTTPHGKEVYTRCYKDAGEQAAPRRTRARRHVRDWPSSFNSFFNDMDDEINELVHQFNRFWFY